MLRIPTAQELQAIQQAQLVSQLTAVTPQLCIATGLSLDKPTSAAGKLAGIVPGGANRAKVALAVGVAMIATKAIIKLTTKSRH